MSLRRSWRLSVAAVSAIATMITISPAALAACGGVYAGSAVFTPLTPTYPASLSHCTLNFVWSGSDGRTYMGTAGHCILPSGGEVSWPNGSGPAAEDGNQRRIGSWAWAAVGSIGGQNVDLALVRLDPAVAVNPGLCGLPGPSGYFGGSLTFPQPLQLSLYGQGDVVGSALPSRPLLALDSQTDVIDAYGDVVGGDSGAPVVTAAGLAVGEIEGLVVHTVDSSAPFRHGTVRVIRLAHQVALAEHDLGISLVLDTVGTGANGRMTPGWVTGMGFEAAALPESVDWSIVGWPGGSTIEHGEFAVEPSGEDLEYTVRAHSAAVA